MKILVISKHTFPYNSPRAFRTAELTEQLAKMGHEVTLYVIKGGYDYSEYEKRTAVRVRNIEARFIPDGTKPLGFFDKVMGRLFGNLLAWPNVEFHFLISRIIKENPGMDMLITIAMPHQIHYGAARAKKKHAEIFPKTWVCDCGDPFMLNPFSHLPKYMKFYEDEWCSACDYIAVPTDTSYKGYYEPYWEKIRVIPQGFDFSKTPISQYKKNQVPTFLFTGAIHPGRSPIKFMDYLLTVDFDYKFYLYMRSPLDEKYVKLSDGRIEYKIGCDRKEIVKACSEMDFLINVKNINNSQTPSKLIDYSISKRPILSISDVFVEVDDFRRFVDGDYSNQLIVDNLDSYKIENVAQAFVSLAK